MSAPILNPSFKWIPAATHGDVTAFADRQKARIAAAEKARKANADEAGAKVRPISRKGQR